MGERNVMGGFRGQTDSGRLAPKADDAGLISRPGLSGSEMISVVIPVYNERDNIAILYRETVKVLEGMGRSFEIICVNDGSTDDSAAALAEIAGTDPRIKVINFRRNHGQTAALMAGFDFSRGDIVIPMDSDLQNDPADIPMLVEKLQEGYSVVSGWRKTRMDTEIMRKLPSKAANWLISRVSGVALHDYGCTLKAYRSDVVKQVRLYGEMHRFIPIYASWLGGRITEMPVRHHARRFGKSKYGINRIVKVVLDLLVVKFLEDYNTKPIYVFGMAGMLLLVLSFAAFFFSVFLRIFEHISLISTPLLLLTAIAFITGMLFILLGLLAELLIRVYYEAQQKPTYTIRNTINLEERP
jgi:glycosyltransferase involved in cell wall biosynthesis